MANARLSKMFLQAASCRRTNVLRPISTTFSRQRLSQDAAGFHTTVKVGKSSVAQTLGEEDGTIPQATKKTRRRKPKATEVAATGVDVEPRPQGTSTEVLPEEKVAKPKLRPTRRYRVSGPNQPGLEARVALPPVETWHEVFPVLKERTKRSRAIIREVNTADMLAEAFVPEGSKDVTVIEISAGPGQLTRSLLRLPKERIKKLVVLEDNPFFFPWQEVLSPYDPRVTVFREDGYDWAGYTKVQESGLLDDIEVIDWQHVHPQLVVIMHLSGDVFGEQLMAQLLRSIPDRQWLFKFGRVPLHTVAPLRMWERMKAIPGELARCKVSVMTQAAAEITETLPFGQLQPYGDHFHPIRITGTLKEGPLEPRGFGSPHAALTATPKIDQIIPPGDLDYWDFCLRKLFVQRATPVQKIIGALGPGASNLVPKLTDPSLPPNDILDMTKTPRSLNLHDWQLLVHAFKAWPFRPENLSIDHFYTGSRRDN